MVYKYDRKLPKDDEWNIEWPSFAKVSLEDIVKFSIAFACQITDVETILKQISAATQHLKLEECSFAFNNYSFLEYCVQWQRQCG